MRFLHISDLHLGKNLYGYSMVKCGDQEYWINGFLKLVEEEKPDAILIAGDIYDNSVAPKEAIKLFNEFIVELSKFNIPVMIVAGNHDSGVRLASLSELIKDHKIYIAGEVKDKIDKVTLTDEYGEVDFWLLPYFFPSVISSVLGLENNRFKNYSEAFKMLLDNQDIDFNKRNVIISHQSVINVDKYPELGGSEEMIGGVGGIDVELYAQFDYAALGHIHAQQKIKYDHVRYCGSPLCYHFDELKRPNKGPLLVEMKAKGEPLKISCKKIEPLHTLRIIDGMVDDILKDEQENGKENEYLKVIIRDDIVPFGCISKLEAVFNAKHSSLMAHEHLPYGGYSGDIDTDRDVRELSLGEAFEEFYKERRGDYPDEDDQRIIKFICEQVLNRPKDEKSDDVASKDAKDLIKFVEKLEEE